MDINFLFAAWKPSWSCSNVGSEDEEYPSILVPCFRSTDFTSTIVVAASSSLPPPPRQFTYNYTNKSCMTYIYQGCSRQSCPEPAGQTNPYKVPTWSGMYIAMCICQRWARATFFGVRNRNSATWRKNFRNRNSATFKGILLRNRYSTIPQSQFFWSPQPQVRNLRASLPQFWHIFGCGVAWNYIFFTARCFLLFREF